MAHIKCIQLNHISVHVPSLLEEVENTGTVMADCPEICWVEPDGYCPHGNPSALLVLGLI